jgi:phosphatidylglycerophosphate synthase
MSLPLSLALIRWTRFSPHAMSVFVMALGFLSGWFFSRGSYGMGVLGALLSWGASVLDGCDGELARLQMKESAFGCWLDTLGDYTYYLAIFVGMTIGAARQTGETGYWWIGGLLLTGTIITLALLVILRHRTTGTQPDLLRTNTKAHFYATGKTWARIVAKLSTCATRATAPYGILVLAILGLVPVVLVLATIGAHVYWVSLAIELRRLLGRASTPTPAVPIPAPAGEVPLGAGTFDTLSTARVVRIEP